MRNGKGEGRGWEGYDEESKGGEEGEGQGRTPPVLAYTPLRRYEILDKTLGGDRAVQLLNFRHVAKSERLKTELVSKIEAKFRTFHPF